MTRSSPAARARLAASLSALLLLGACASGGPERAAVATAPDADVPTLPSADGTGSLNPLEPYRAASGRLCRRLAAPDGTVLNRASCRGADGRWRLGRSLGQPVPTAAPTFGRAAPARDGLRIEPVAPVAPRNAASPDDTTAVTLRPGETLWSFARRVTGDPLDWTRIARLNGLPDGDAVEAGRELTVPTALVRGAL